MNVYWGGKLKHSSEIFSAKGRNKFEFCGEILRKPN